MDFSAARGGTRGGAAHEGRESHRRHLHEPLSGVGRPAPARCISRRFESGLAYCLDHEEHTFSVCMRGSRVTELVRRGSNDDAIDLALVTMQETISPVNRMHLGIGLTWRASDGPSRCPRLAGRALEAREQQRPDVWLIQVAAAAAQGAWLCDGPCPGHRRGRVVYHRGLQDDRGCTASSLSGLPCSASQSSSTARSIAVLVGLHGDHLGAAEVGRTLAGRSRAPYRSPWPVT